MGSGFPGVSVVTEGIIVETENGFRYANGDPLPSWGTYDFVTMNGQILVGHGHEFMSGGHPVDYAGEIVFGTSYNSNTRVTVGKIVSWNNKSGHRQCRSDDAHKAGLPIELFKSVEAIRQDKLKEIAQKLAPCSKMLDWDPEILKQVLNLPSEYTHQITQILWASQGISLTDEEITHVMDMARVTEVMEEPPLLVGVTGPQGPSGPVGVTGPTGPIGAAGPSVKVK